MRHQQQSSYPIYMKMNVQLERKRNMKIDETSAAVRSTYVRLPVAASTNSIYLHQLVYTARSNGVRGCACSLFPTDCVPRCNACMYRLQGTEVSTICDLSNDECGQGVRCGFRPHGALLKRSRRGERGLTDNSGPLPPMVSAT